MCVVTCLQEENPECETGAESGQRIHVDPLCTSKSFPHASGKDIRQTDRCLMMYPRCT